MGGAAPIRGSVSNHGASEERSDGDGRQAPGSLHANESRKYGVAQRLKANMGKADLVRAVGQMQGLGRQSQESSSSQQLRRAGVNLMPAERQNR